MTSSNGNIFRVTGHLCGNSLVPGEFPAQRPVTRSFYVFFDLRLNERLSKQSWGWWFETLSCPLCRQCNVKGFHCVWSAFWSVILGLNWIFVGSFSIISLQSYKGFDCVVVIDRRCPVIRNKCQWLRFSLETILALKLCISDIKGLQWQRHLRASCYSVGILTISRIEASK